MIMNLRTDLRLKLYTRAAARSCSVLGLTHVNTATISVLYDGLVRLGDENVFSSYLPSYSYLFTVTRLKVSIEPLTEELQAVSFLQHRRHTRCKVIQQVVAQV